MNDAIDGPNHCQDGHEDQEDHEQDRKMHPKGERWDLLEGSQAVAIKDHQQRRRDEESVQETALGSISIR